MIMSLWRLLYSASQMTRVLHRDSFKLWPFYLASRVNMTSLDPLNVNLNKASSVPWFLLLLLQCVCCSRASWAWRGGCCRSLGSRAPRAGWWTGWRGTARRTRTWCPSGASPAKKQNLSYIGHGFDRSLQKCLKSPRIRQIMYRDGVLIKYLILLSYSQKILAT